MDQFDPERLKQLRKQRGISVADVAGALGVSVAQVHRLENGQRRLTVDTLIQYCDVLELELCQLFAQQIDIAVTGVVNSDYEVLPTPPDSVHQIALPAILPDIDQVAALRWEPGGKISRMHGHILLYYSHSNGVPRNAWETRCLIVRADGSQCTGWPINGETATHIENPEGRTQFNVDIIWASPILAVLAPSAIKILQGSA
ncbi:MAG: transcriptional regulator with XRE-family HTH domain [Candidatus Azotimanducaceae bacterium]|jgi:transcriptional regulator with XRE-family HTH domain